MANISVEKWPKSRINEKKYKRCPIDNWRQAKQNSKQYLASHRVYGVEDKEISDENENSVSTFTGHR